MQTLKVGSNHFHKMRITMLLGLVSIFTLPSFGQITNDSIFKQLLIPYFNANGYTYKTIGGFEASSWFPRLSADSSLIIQLNITQPRIQYSKLENDQYLREIRVSIAKVETEKQLETLIFKDTLSANTLRKVNRKSSAILRGQDPTPLGKWIKPIVLIVVSIGGVLSLFYTRSR